MINRKNIVVGAVLTVGIFISFQNDGPTENEVYNTLKATGFISKEVSNVLEGEEVEKLRKLGKIKLSDKEQKYIETLLS